MSKTKSTGTWHWMIARACGIGVLGLWTWLAAIMMLHHPLARSASQELRGAPGMYAEKEVRYGDSTTRVYNEMGWLRNPTSIAMQRSSERSNCVTTRWTTAVDFADDEEYYDLLANIVNQFAKYGIQLLLYGGSLLGARRHFGIMPWDGDVDFMVFTTNTTAINHVLDNDLKLEWRYNTDGDGPGTTGFGYHVYTPFRDIDFWLYGSINATHSSCVGVENGCQRWYRRFWNAPPPVYETDQLLPCSAVPFGPRMFPCPRDVDGVLDRMYTPSWTTRCQGWSQGEVPCQSLFGEYAFVHTDGEVHTLKNETTVIAAFSVINGTYRPITIA